MLRADENVGSYFFRIFYNSFNEMINRKEEHT